MAPYPEEIDVFTVPHSRMKQLVDVYREKLTCTDFADYLALEALLQDLHSTFCEFKSHEQIENKYIMKKLKKRLKSLSIHDAAVCNCHSDNRLSDMLSLLEDGYSCSSKPESERINFGLKLQNALQEFTGVFLPHMREEEEVFQPMLMKYFEYDELKCLKEQVIQEHSKWCTFNFKEEKFGLEKAAFDFRYEKEAKDKCEDDSFQLPPEILSHVFSFLLPHEILQCSGVCRSWYNVSRNPALWKTLYPCYWAHGIWGQYDSNPEDMIQKLYPKSPYPPEYYRDEDADVVDLWEDDACGRSESTADSNGAYPAETTTLNSLIKFLLPRVGPGVQKIVLSSCRGLTSSQLREMLILCPNVVYLDVSYTSIADSAFKSLKDHNSCVKLQHLNLSGCKGISDLGLFRLTESMAIVPPVLPDGSSDLREVYLEHCDPLNNYCPCSQNPGSLCHEIEDSGLFLQRANRDVYEVCSTSFINGPICLWQRNGFMCHLARQAQQCPYMNPCACAGTVDFSEATNDILRTTMLRETDPVSTSRNVGSSDQCTETRGSSLRYLNLSGCKDVTDSGLRCLVEAGLFEMLEFFDVSGCWLLTGPGLCSMVEFAPNLSPEHIYYCNQIEDGPYPDTANGCQNLESDMRVCCCNRRS